MSMPTLDTLTSQYAALETQIAVITAKINVKPICGKPGHGFKAQRKAKAILRALQAQLAALYDAIRAEIRANKASKDRQFKKLAYVRQTLPNFDVSRQVAEEDNYHV